MECYFDNAATTAVFPEVKELMMTLLDVDYGNPSSQHKKGLTAKDYERTATEQVAKTLKCMPKEIVFTSGGTEANNLALIGAALAHRRAGKHIITTPIEHASVLSTVEFLQKEGFEISFMEVGSDGKVDLDSLSKLLRDDTILVSCMYVNNEIGTIQPISKISKLVHNHDCLFHCDAVQAIGHLPIDVKEIGVDYLSASAHKFNGPKGIGFLYVKNGSPITSLISGGAQESHLRAGTENVASIVGMSVALQENVSSLQKNMTYIQSLEKILLGQLTAAGIEFVHNGGTERTPGNISLSFKGQNGEAILHRLDLKGICVSTGSACDSTSNQVSHVLKAIGLSPEYAEGTIRISLCHSNTIEDIAYLTANLIRVVS